MSRSLIDLLWREHPDAPSGGSRGPRARVATGTVVDTAVRTADSDGLPAVTIRRLASELDVSTMSVYTHVNSRDDLLVLMVDAAHAQLDLTPYGRLGWKARVRRVAESNLALLRAHPWVGDVLDDRTALGPGTIAKYDHELHALDPLDLAPLTRDAALTHLLGFVRTSARAFRPSPGSAELAENWPEWSTRLAAYLGDDHPLAQSVGAAAGEAMAGASDAQLGWEFGLARVLDGLATLT